MKRYIRCSTLNKYGIQPGDPITVYNSKEGYTNYEADFIESYINRDGHEIAIIEKPRERGQDEVYYNQIIPSQRDYFYSLTLSDVLTPEFVASMVHNKDSIWCKNVRYSRVDRDMSIENVVRNDAYIGCSNHSGTCMVDTPRFKVSIVSYISKHGSIDRDVICEYDLLAGDELVYEALDVLRHADEVVVNFAGYQRTLRRINK